MITLRQMEARDVAEAQRSSFDTFRDAHDRYGGDFPRENTRATIEWGVRRISHLLSSDPLGAVVAERGDRIVGVAMASMREGLWFLSLLTVDTEAQGRGVGRRLLDASLDYGQAVDSRLILASTDPKALRRYHAAGFELEAAYRAEGRLRRDRLPRAGSVRTGDYQADADLVHDVARQVRGASLGPEFALYAASGSALYVHESDAGVGYAVGGPSGVQCLAATSGVAAQALLWTALAEATSVDLGVQWLTARQQWALPVILEAGLVLQNGPSVCTQGLRAPFAPYIPAGAYG